MKNLTLIILLFLLLPTASFAQDDEMQKWMEYMTPGKEHKMLAAMSGEWNFEHKYWSMDPTAEPTISTGTASCEMILEGRYSQMKVNSSVMGMPFNGISLTGYDNGKKVYFSTWIDNMSTGMLYSEGTYDEATKTTVMKGKMFEPILGKDIETKEIIKWLDEKTMQSVTYNIIEGKEIKTMEIKYTKK